VTESGPAVVSSPSKQGRPRQVLLAAPRGYCAGVDRAVITVEKALVDNAFGTTIFQFPQVVGWNTNKVTNVDAIPLSPAVFYNFWEWQPVS